MKEKLAKLYNTMNMIETKGQNTIIMSDCLKYLTMLISEEEKKIVSNAETTEGDKNANIEI
jgi:hypothetical protein